MMYNTKDTWFVGKEIYFDIVKYKKEMSSKYKQL